jgi:hypothetical protein
MENPYWHPEEKRHVVNGDDVRDLAFDIFNIIRASAALKAESGLRAAEEDVAEPNSMSRSTTSGPNTMSPASCFAKPLRGAWTDSSS